MHESNGNGAEDTENEENSTLTIPSNILTDHALATEFAEVCRQPIDGVFVAPRNENRCVWSGVIFVRKGLYGGGIFRFNLKFPDDFPSTTSLPVISFEKPIFHPAISDSNELNLSRSFPDGWKREKHNIRRVLVVLQRSFYSIDADSESCANPKAAILYKENRCEFRERVMQNVSSSRASVYDEPVAENSDSNSIKSDSALSSLKYSYHSILLPWDATIHQPTRERMIQIGSGIANHGTSAEFRNDKLTRFLGVELAETVGRSYPRSYSWFDPTTMTVVTLYDQLMDVEEQDLKTSAGQDREKYGIEPLDLSMMSIEQDN